MSFHCLARQDDYAAEDPYFAQTVVNGPMRALADGEDGPNGLYRYSSTSVFPNSNHNSSNYFVDVVFTYIRWRHGT